MIYRTLGINVFVLIIVLTGTELFGQNSWWLGFGAGVVLLVAWHLKRQLGILLLVALVIVGILMEFFPGLLAANNLIQSSRAFFNGMTLGCLTGSAIGVALRWQHVKPRLVQLARDERVIWLSALLGDSDKSKS